MTPALPPPIRPRRALQSVATDETTTRLALAARDGDPESVEEFIRALRLDVWRYVAYLSAEPQSADDLTQETFLRALRSLPGFEGRSSARTWLLSIARRTVVDSFRRAATRPAVSRREDWQPAAEQSQPGGLPGFDDGIALAELLATVPEDGRRAFVLTQLVGLPYAEAALVIGCPIGTVRSRVARARSTLLQLITESDDPAGPPPRDPVQVIRMPAVA
ncbi:sigma-70 family RNA polymerase sigma factor [Streptomyces sp. NBC_00963]|uniref:sigma-70 family RNA polymerase sigma factor n=1 Tax=Streptomyces sp. NBC_00963 TaxID=2903697 RepID=UPI003863509F|nr:sigma-70 family RNA polymerase sigma factor [Streptomyces sp. NBC_00963]